MIVKTGRAEVWAHCGEAGLQDDIKMISKYFDIDDISVVYGDKFTYMNNRPRKYVRVPATPSLAMYREEGKKIFKKGAKK